MAGTSTSVYEFDSVGWRPLDLQNGIDSMKYCKWCKTEIRTIDHDEYAVPITKGGSVALLGTNQDRYYREYAHFY